MVGLLAAVLAPVPTLAGWFKEPCPKGPDGRCVTAPCDPFLDRVRLVADYRRKADDPRCPAQEQSNRLAELNQEVVDREQATMSTECIAKAAAIMRAVASINVQRSYPDDVGDAVAVVRYTNNARRTVQSATITCSALHGAAVVAVGKAVVSGPVPADAGRDVRVTIALAGAPFSCVQCDLTLER